ncbi:MAG: hypothetical protein R3E02_12180 [Blastomonas sp.]
MADRRTARLLRQSALRRTALPVALAAVLGLVLRFAIGFEPAGGLLQIFGVAVESLPAIKQWLAGSAEGKFVTTWLSAPIVTGFVTAGAIAAPPVKAWLQRVFPDPPPFVRSDLEERRNARMIGLDRTAPAFIGRADELSALARLRESVPVFAWQFVTGPSGIGKSRLAIEWLEEARKAGWDIGIIDPRDRDLLRDWTARRPTALVIDEAVTHFQRDLGDALAMLAKGARRASKVRVLVLDQKTPPLVFQEDRTGSSIEASRRDDLVLAPLAPDHILELGQNDPAGAAANSAPAAVTAPFLIAQAAGRPLAALALAEADEPASLEDAMRQWVNRLIPGLAPRNLLEEPNPAQPVDPAMALCLIVAALNGPCPADVVRSAAGPLSGNSLSALLRFFPGYSRGDLDSELPLFEPGILGSRLALCLLANMSRDERETAYAMLSHDPDRLARNLGDIWRSNQDFAGALAAIPIVQALAELQDYSDRTHPAYAEALSKRSARMTDYSLEQVKLSQAGEPIVGEAALLQLVDLHREIAQSRPFDTMFQHNEVNLLANLVFLIGQRGTRAGLDRLLSPVSDHFRRVQNGERGSDAPCTAMILSNLALVRTRPQDMERTEALLLGHVDHVHDRADSCVERELHFVCKAVANAHGPSALNNSDPAPWRERLERFSRLERVRQTPELLGYMLNGWANCVMFLVKSGDLDAAGQAGETGWQMVEELDPSLREKIVRDAAMLIQNMQMEEFKANPVHRSLWNGRFRSLREELPPDEDPQLLMLDAGMITNSLASFSELGSDDRAYWLDRLEKVEEQALLHDDPLLQGRLILARFGAHAPEIGEGPGGMPPRLEEILQRHDNSPSRLVGGAMARVLRLVAHELGAAGRLDDMNACHARLYRIADRPANISHVGIRNDEALAARCAMRHHIDARNEHGAGFENARFRLAMAAQQFPLEGDIQEAAHAFGISALDQQPGYPLGRAPAIVPDHGEDIFGSGSTHFTLEIN